MSEWIWRLEVLLTLFRKYVSALSSILGRPAYTPDSAKIILGPGFEDDHVKPMADAMGCRRDAGDPRADNCDLWATKMSAGAGRVRREDLVRQPLYELVQKQDWVEDRVPHLGIGTHCEAASQGEDGDEQCISNTRV